MVDGNDRVGYWHSRREKVKGMGDDGWDEKGMEEKGEGQSSLHTGDLALDTLPRPKRAESQREPERLPGSTHTFHASGSIQK